MSKKRLDIKELTEMCGEIFSEDVLNARERLTASAPTLISMKSKLGSEISNWKSMACTLFKIEADVVSVERCLEEITRRVLLVKRIDLELSVREIISTWYR